MNILPIDTKTMSPRHEISRLLSNVKSLTVKIGSRKYAGKAMLEETDGHLTLVFKTKSLVDNLRAGKKR